jgi:hypothetical protein
MIGVFKQYAFRPRRTPTYTRRRRVRPRKHVERATAPRDTEAVMFDHHTYELPRATIRSEAGVAGYVGQLRGWFATRWTWLRPRMLPVVVALVGAVGLLESGRYLSDMASGRIARTVPAHHIALDSSSHTR